MSNDARYLLHYEMQDYADDFPLSAVEELTSQDVVWLHEPTLIDKYGFEFYCETKHTYPDVIRKVSRADQVLECKDGENWVDITYV